MPAAEFGAHLQFIKSFRKIVDRNQNKFCQESINLPRTQRNIGVSKVPIVLLIIGSFSSVDTNIALGSDFTTNL